MGFFSKIKNLFGSGADENTHEELQQNQRDILEIAEDISDEELLVALRTSNQKLSDWLNIILQHVEEKGELLDKRIAFLLKSLGIEEAESEKFIVDFNAWLSKMDYRFLDEFRSELQYRLSLALELEDEEDEKNRLILKLNTSLTKTREQLLTGINVLFSQHTELDSAFWEELEELFIMSDMGFESAQALANVMKKAAATKNITTPQELLPHFAEEVEKLFAVPKRIEAVNPPEVILMVGVNGVGKTTTVAKLAYRSKMQGKKVLIVAADTFRAAAIEQLEVWTQRIGVDFYAKVHGSDPAAVAFEAMYKALEGVYDTVYIDTAGRLHTKTNLMDELTKIRNVISKKHESAPHRTILIIDATTGQNALQQTKLFSQSAHVSEIILTKLDGTAKGGVALAIASQFNAPITYIGLGEKLEDLRPFDAHDFAHALIGKLTMKPNVFTDLNNQIKKDKPAFIVYLILQAFIVLTMVRAIFRGEYESVFICFLTIILLLMPAFLEKKLKFRLPAVLEIIVMLFIFAAEILGEINAYYIKFENWDMYLHTINGFLCAAIGIGIIDLLNSSNRRSINLSPMYVAIAAFCFSMTVGVLWEFFEYGADMFLGTDMQKDTIIYSINSVMLNTNNENIPVLINNISQVTINGEVLPINGYLDIGLIDTMADLFVNFIGALIFSIIGFFYVKAKGKGKFAKYFIPRRDDA